MRTKYNQQKKTLLRLKKKLATKSNWMNYKKPNPRPPTIHQILQKEKEETTGNSETKALSTTNSISTSSTVLERNEKNPREKIRTCLKQKRKKNKKVKINS